MLLSFKQTVVVASTYATTVNQNEWIGLLYQSLLGGGRLSIGLVTHPKITLVWGLGPDRAISSSHCK